jgi:hypothetical protein
MDEQARREAIRPACTNRRTHSIKNTFRGEGVLQRNISWRTHSHLFLIAGENSMRELLKFGGRFADERTPIEVTPLSATSAELSLSLGLGLGLDSLAHFSLHTLPFFSPSSFHTLALSPASTSV